MSDHLWSAIFSVIVYCKRAATHAIFYSHWQLDTLKTVLRLESKAVARVASYYRQLLTPNQSGFRPADSSINQLLSITHMYSAFDEFPSRETRAVFPDIPKALKKCGMMVSSLRTTMPYSATTE